jgi:hypothetical protein
MKVRRRKYDCPTKQIIEIIELFQPIGVVDIIQLAGLESTFAFANGIIRALEETGVVVRDDDTGMYWMDNE